MLNMSVFDFLWLCFWFDLISEKNLHVKTKKQKTQQKPTYFFKLLGLQDLQDPRTTEISNLSLFGTFIFPFLTSLQILDFLRLSSSIAVQNCKTVWWAAGNSALNSLVYLRAYHERLMFECSSFQFVEHCLPLQSIIFPGACFLLALIITISAPNRYAFFSTTIFLKTQSKLVPFQFTGFSCKP